MLWLDAISENHIFAENKNKKSTQKGEPKWPFFKIGLHWKRSKLYQRTDLRSEILFKKGLIAETREILYAALFHDYRERYDIWHLNVCYEIILKNGKSIS